MDKKTKAEQREAKRKTKMKVSGQSVLSIKRIIDEKAKYGKKKKP